jgi:hypothetical protein
MHHIAPHHTLEVVLEVTLEVILEHMLEIKTMTFFDPGSCSNS